MLDVQFQLYGMEMANADEIVRQQCRAREDAERLHRTLDRDNSLLKKELNDK